MKKLLIIISVLIIFVLGIVLALNTNFNKNQTIELKSNVEGKIVELLISENSPVKKGEIVAKTNTEEYEKELDEAQKKLDEAQKELKISSEDSKKINDALKKAKDELDYAQSNLENANNDYVRYKNDFSDGVVTQKDLNNALKNLEIAKEQYNKAQENLNNVKNSYQNISKNNPDKNEIDELLKQVENAKIKLSDTTIVSPYDGTVLKLNVKIEDNIKEGDTIAVIALDGKETLFKIFKFEVVKVKKGQKSTFEINPQK